MSSKFLSELFILITLLFSFNHLNAAMTGYGNGGLGNVTLNAGTHYADNVKTKIISIPAHNKLRVQSVSGFTAGDAIFMIDMEDGSYEIERIASISGDTFTISTSLQQIIFSPDLQVIKMREYRNLTVLSGATLTCSPYNHTTGLGGVVAFLVLDTFFMNGGTVDASAKGFPGGFGGFGGPGGFGGTGGINGSHDVGGIGELWAGHGGLHGDDGTGGSSAVNYNFPGSSTTAANLSTSTNIFLGAGGYGGDGKSGGQGGGGSGGVACFPGMNGENGYIGSDGGNGGRGGGIIIFKSKNFKSNVTVFDVRGENGTSGTKGGAGGCGGDGICGGGGGGGGKGGPGGNGGNGGAGGRIAIGSLGNFPLISQLRLTGGGSGSAGGGGQPGQGGFNSRDTCHCSDIVIYNPPSCPQPTPPPVSIPVPSPGGPGGGGDVVRIIPHFRCRMDSVLKLIDKIDSYVVDGLYTNDSLTCEISEPYYDFFLDKYIIYGVCRIVNSNNDTTFFSGSFDEDTIIYDKIKHLIDDDVPFVITSSSYNTPTGIHNYIPCSAYNPGDPGEDGDGGSGGEDGGYNFWTEPLPVTIRNLEHLCNDNNLTITWTTENELNNDFFSVYVSKDAIKKQKIAEIPGNGTKSTPTPYTWTDNNFHSEFPYYHLQQTDYDGTNKWVETIYAACENQSLDQLRVGYLSNSKQIIIHHSGEKPETVQWQLYNIMGAVVRKGMYSTNESTEHYLNDLHFSQGIYFLHIHTPQQQKVFPVEIF